MAFTAGMDLTAQLLNEAFGIVARKNSDETVNNSATFQDDDDLQWSLQASQVYRGRIVLMYNSGTTPDLKVQWVLPSGASIRWGVVGYDSAGTFGSTGGHSTASTRVLGGTAANVTATIEFVITMSTTAGTAVLQWAQNTANASNTTVLTGSFGVVQRVI